MSLYELSTEHNPMLATLGVASIGDAPVKKIIQDVRSLIPSLWQPTWDVLTLTVHRALKADHLQMADYPCNTLEPNLTLTPAGRRHLQNLLLHPPIQPQGPSSLVTETLKSCFGQPGTLFPIHPEPLVITCMNQ